MSSKILAGSVLVVVLATGTSAIAASTNPWALHPQQGQLKGQAQGNMQGGFNMGGGLTLGGGQPQASVITPQFAAPQPVVPVLPTAPKPSQSQPIPAPSVTPPQFGAYPPLSSGNTQTTMINPAPQIPPMPRPVRPYNYGQPYNYGPSYNYGQPPNGFNPGYGGFGFPGFGGFSGFNNFGFGFGGGFVAPGPVYPRYGNPYRQNYQQPAYRVQPGRSGN